MLTSSGFTIVKKEIDDCFQEGHSLEKTDRIIENAQVSGCSKEQDFQIVEYFEFNDDDVIEGRTTDVTNSLSTSKNIFIQPIINDVKSLGKYHVGQSKKLPKNGKKDESLKMKQHSKTGILKPSEACQREVLGTKDAGITVIKEELDECFEEGEYLDEMDTYTEYDSISGCIKEQVFENVEYLEINDDEVTEGKTTTAKSKNTVIQHITNEAESLNMTKTAESRKWPIKKKKDERLKIYKKYAMADMLRAVEIVLSGMLSTKEAAKVFNVPRKTLATRLRIAKKTQDISEDSDNKRKKKNHYQFIEEVKKILTYTNAVPFKTKAARYFCTYCSTDGPCFEDPDELRAHTRTEHVDDKTRNIEMVLQPQNQNEVIKMDIDSLHCTVCCTVIPAWTDMFQHLEESHSIELDEAYTKVIPYVLKRDLKCALCNESFPNYHHLDGHMNSHYASYICSECGDTFLSASRLSKHLKVHNTGRFPCETCGKVFARDRYRQKHFDHVHKQEHNIKCLYCPEKFYGTFQRHLHMVEKHKEKVSVTTCELCGMSFEWRRYYVAHMRRKHNIRTI